MNKTFTIRVKEEVEVKQIGNVFTVAFESLKGEQVDEGDYIAIPPIGMPCYVSHVDERRSLLYLIPYMKDHNPIHLIPGMVCIILPKTVQLWKELTEIQNQNLLSLQ